MWIQKIECGLPDNAVLNILEDNKQTLWLSTPNGISNNTVQDVNSKSGTAVAVSCKN